jgi:hypothetical protein
MVEEFGSEKVTAAMNADQNEAMPSGHELYIDGGRTAADADQSLFSRLLGRQVTKIAYEQVTYIAITPRVWNRLVYPSRACTNHQNIG